jgi:hypothetical protein
MSAPRVRVEKESRCKAMVALSTAADAFAANTLPVIHSLHAAGVTDLRGLAAAHAAFALRAVGNGTSRVCAT